MNRIESDDGKSNRELAVDLLIAYRVWIVLALIGVGGVLWFVQPSMPEVELARSHKVFLVAALLGGGIAVLPAAKIIAWLYDPPRRFLVQPGLTADTGAIYELTPKQFEEMTVEEGQLFEWPETKYPTYGVIKYDPVTNTAKGTWRGTASDEELLANEDQIEEIRGDLEDKAQAHDVIKTRAERIVREEILRNTRQLIQEYNTASIVDIHRVSDRLEQAVAEHDLTDELSRADEQRTDVEDDTGVDASTDQPVREAATDGGNDGE